MLLNKSDMISSPPPLRSEDKCDWEKSVDISIICSLSSLIKHISGRQSTNDSYHFTHTFSRFRTTTTWPWGGLTCLLYRVKACLCDPPHHLQSGCGSSPDVSLSSAKNSCREKCNYYKIIILLPFDFSDWIHEYIWIHLGTQSELPPAWTPHVCVWLVAFSLLLQSVSLQKDLRVSLPPKKPRLYFTKLFA